MEFETSMMLYLFPHLVDESRISHDPPADFPPYDLYPANLDWVPPSGCLSPAHGSSAGIGKLLVTDSQLGSSLRSRSARSAPPRA